MNLNEVNKSLILDCTTVATGQRVFHHCSFAIISSFVSVPVWRFGRATPCSMPTFGKYTHLSSFLAQTATCWGLILVSRCRWNTIKVKDSLMSHYTTWEQGGGKYWKLTNVLLQCRQFPYWSLYSFSPSACLFLSCRILQYLFCWLPLFLSYPSACLHLCLSSSIPTVFLTVWHIPGPAGQEDKNWFTSYCVKCFPCS